MSTIGRRRLSKAQCRGVESGVGLFLVWLAVEQRQFALIADEVLPGALDSGGERDFRVGCQPEPEIVGRTVGGCRVVEEWLRRWLELDEHFGGGLGQAFP
jgi:hypothetical protein